MPPKRHFNVVTADLAFMEPKHFTAFVCPCNVIRWEGAEERKAQSFLPLVSEKCPNV